MTTMNYIIMSSPRTGSSMVCNALAGSSLAGKPEEFLHQAGLENAGHPENNIETLKHYMRKIISENTSQNGVFGMKMHLNQFDNIFSEKRNGLKNGIEFLGSFQKYILIYRHDKILQAISELLAEESGIWNSEEMKSRFSLGRPLQSTDVLTITEIMSRQIYEEYAWRAILRQLGTEFHSIRYEDLVSETERELQGVKNYLNIKELEPVNLVAKTVKVADPTITLRMKQDYLISIGCS